MASLNYGKLFPTLKMKNVFCRFLCEVAAGHFNAPESAGIVENLNLQGEVHFIFY
jgi:hypothetical protein